MKKVELSIKEFAVFILRNWSVVLAFMLVAGMLFGELGEGSFQQQIQNKQAEYEAAMVAYEISMADYEKALEEYERAPELNAIRLGELKKERDELKAYFEDSFLMNIDPDNKQIASITIQITGNDGKSINYNTVRQINERYFALAVDAPIKTLFSNFSLKEYDEKYLNEMYGVSKGTFDLLTITAFGNKDIDAEKCVQAVYDYLISKQDAVIEGSGVEHSISIISRKNSKVIDTALKTQQTKQEQQLDTIESEIDTLETLVLEKPEEPEAQQPPEVPEVPQAPLATPYNFFSQTPYGIAIGFTISVLVLSLLYVLRLPVQLPEQMQRQLDITYLGGIKKRSKVLNPGAKLAGSLRLLDEEKAVGLIAANINEVLGAHRRILVTGSAPEDAIEAFTKSMEKALKLENTSFSFAKDVNADAEAVSMLSDADAVLLVERLNHSRLRKVNQMKDRIELSEKNILGYVLV